MLELTVPGVHGWSAWVLMRQAPEQSSQSNTGGRAGKPLVKVSRCFVGALQAGHSPKPLPNVGWWHWQTKRASKSITDGTEKALADSSQGLIGKNGSPGRECLKLRDPKYLMTKCYITINSSQSIHRMYCYSKKSRIQCFGNLTNNRESQDVLLLHRFFF